ncbi:MAG: replication-associated recombination protein A [Candidatus Gracilibacteria bacterium]|nr:replication-associated recombination protein A [Candidatus Gracilibacteria bacterium]
MTNLFSKNSVSVSPLADKLRPKSLDEYVGQHHLLKKGEALRKMIEEDNLSSMILVGPAGCGKTSLSHVISQITGANFVEFSAVMQGVSDLRKVVTFAQGELDFSGKKTILFVDEIHRLNKAQQDAFLPHTEKGVFVLIGATTENPSFTINNALLSRVHVFKMESLSEGDLVSILEKTDFKIDADAKSLLVNYAEGDARKMISALEYTSKAYSGVIKKEHIMSALRQKTLLYDRNSEEHYGLISAFIKSMRGSDRNAAVYYLARMLHAGEDPRFLARRMMIFASEDIGLANSHALTLAANAYLATEKIGMPEVKIILSHVVSYLSMCKKDNTTYKAINKAWAEVERSGSLAVPIHLLNAPTKLMQEWGYGEGYEYAHDLDDKKPSHGHLPEDILGMSFFD